MFMGQYEHTIDAKGRTIIPAKYREGLGETFIITRGLDGCLYLYPSDAWQEFADKLQSLPSTLQNRKIQRQCLDKQGRILVPALHREMADLEKDVIFVGMMNRVELWDKARYNTEETEEDEELLASAMDTLDISL